MAMLLIAMVVSILVVSAFGWASTELRSPGDPRATISDPHIDTDAVQLPADPDAMTLKEAEELLDENRKARDLSPAEFEQLIEDS